MQKTARKSNKNGTGRKLWACMDSVIKVQKTSFFILYINKRKFKKRIHYIYIKEKRKKTAPTVTWMD